MTHAEKRIAKIYFDAKVFITKQGELYGYQLRDGLPRCYKLSPKDKIVFWDYLTSRQKEELYPWRPAARKAADLKKLERVFAEQNRLNERN